MLVESSRPDVHFPCQRLANLTSAFSVSRPVPIRCFLSGNGPHRPNPDNLSALLKCDLLRIRRKQYSRSVKCWIHRRGLLPLLLACLWIATAAFAEHASAEFPLCQPERSPCCPPSANTTNISCPACSLSAPIAANDKSEHEASRSVPHANHTPGLRTGLPVAASVRELTPGLRYQRTVFALKDDLRV